MTDIHVFELIGTDRDARLAFHQAQLDSLSALTSGAMPQLRVLEYLPQAPSGTNWAAMERLHLHLYKLFHNDLITEWLRHHEQVMLDITGTPRLLTSSVAALRAQAAIAEPMIVLDMDVPESVDVDALIDTWQLVLDPGYPATAPRTITRLPPPSPRAAAAADDVLRNLLTDPTRFLDSETVGRRLSGNPDHASPRVVTSRARKAGDLLGVWDGNAFRYPAFQFDPDGKPLARLPDLLAVLPSDADGSFRNAALWLFAPDAALGDRCPADVFARDPDRVLELRRRRLDTTHAGE